MGIVVPMTAGNAPFFVDTEVIILNRDGIWLSDGVEIDHDKTRKLFAKSLIRDAQGWYLQVGRETKRIVVEDTAYFVTRVDGTPATGYELLLNDETRERLVPSSLTYRPGRLACTIKGGQVEAKFISPAYFDLLKELEEDANSFYLVIENRRILLASK